MPDDSGNALASVVEADNQQELSVEEQLTRLMQGQPPLIFGQQSFVEMAKRSLTLAEDIGS
jgi:hypothetical protein